MPKPTTESAGWQCDFFEKARSPATAAKHAELGRAFDAWLDRGPQGRPFRTVFDGFAGAGRFGGGDNAPGSPLLLLEHARARPEAGPLRFVFSEPNAQNFARLRASVASDTHGGHSVVLECSSFQTCASAVLATLGGPAGDPPGALFSFVDPYAYEGLDAETLAALAARGDLVLHVASRALYTKLTGTNGQGERQARRMGRLLGGALAWDELRAAATGLSPAQAQRLLAERMAAGFTAGVPGVHTRIVTLRDGATHVVTVSRTSGAVLPRPAAT